MPLTLAQLLAAPDAATARATLLNGLQGFSIVRRTLGVSPGSVGYKTSVGTPSGAFACRLKVSTAGDLGTAQVQLSTDGGLTYGAAVAVPPNGEVAVAGTGVTLKLTNGPVGGGTSFLLGDIFAFDLSVPTLPVTAWQPGSTPLSLLEVFAQGLADAYASVLAVAKGGLIPYSSGAWLDLLSQGFYSLTRTAAQTAQHTVRVTDASGGGPYTVNAGAFYVGTVGGLRFIAQTGGAVPQNGFLDITVQAESPGSLYNVGVGAINLILTPLPGATCTNRDIGGTSITRQGLDAETDASLQARALARWPALGLGANAQVYDLLAKAASTSVTRTRVAADLTVAGQVDIWLAGAGGAVSGPTVTTVQTYLNSRVPLCTTILAASAAAVTVAVTGTVYVRRGYLANAQPAVLAALNALINGTDIGGTIYFSAVEGAIQGVQGVRNAALTAPLADVVLTPTQVATPDLSGLLFVEI